jgi:hypothetical protein
MNFVRDLVFLRIKTLTIYLIVLIGCQDRVISQEFEKRNFKKTVEEIGYKWSFERNYLISENDKLLQFSIQPGNYLEMEMFQDELWFKDWVNMNFLVYNTSTKNENTIGKKGAGPDGEMGQIMFFDVSQSGVHLYDFKKRSFNSYSKNDFSFQGYYQNRNMAFYRGAYMDDDKYFLRYDDDMKDHGFSFIVYDAATSNNLSILSIPKLLGVKPFDHMYMAYAGRFVKSYDKKTILYYCRYGGLFFNFSSNGEFRYVSKTVDETPIPDVKRIDFGEGFAIRPVVEFNFFIDATANSTAFLLLNVLESKSGNVIDVYDINIGNYTYSISIPNLKDGQEAKLIACNEDYVYVMFEENDVIRYELAK